LTPFRPNRRQLLAGGSATLLLGGCDRIGEAPSFQQLLRVGEAFSYRAQRLIVPRTALAPEFTKAEISKTFRPNGSQDSYTLPPEWADMRAGNYANWRLAVDGLVLKPAQFSLADLKSMSTKTQITRHDCVEGWSCIGQWTGVPLSAVLDRVGLKPEARFIVFHCADEQLRYMEGKLIYYESIDLIDAFHPQTILAYALNGAPLPLANGAPLRLRLERQLGYKMAKFITRIEAVDRFDSLRGGRGGYWEDQGYEWYAGI
jgi:DMSO/TMAO reductase YedYZ molybdopterin-dependent catalytic subunit